MKITKLEGAMLCKIARDQFQPANGSDPKDFSETGHIWSECIIESKQDQGVLMSLLEKKLVGHSGYVEGRLNGKKRNDAEIWLTELGFGEYRKLFPLQTAEVAKPEKTHWNVGYFSAIGGGSGITRVAIADLPQWLKDNPGFLIRELT